jgi:von Willebrand factor type A domain
MNRFQLVLMGIFFALAVSLPQLAVGQFTVCYNGVTVGTDPVIVNVVDGVYADISLYVYDGAGVDCGNPPVTLKSGLTWGLIVPDALNVIGLGNPALTITKTAVAGISQVLSFGASPLRNDPFKFSITVSDGTNQTLSFILVYATSKLSDISLVLDVSGSMGIVAEAASSLTATRLDILKTATNSFIDVYNVFSLSVNNTGPNAGQTDKLGVVYFTTNVIASIAANTMIDLDGASTTVNAIKAEISGQIPQQLTAMGAGLNAGITQLGSVAGRTKNIVLFTDGIQNVAPDVDDPGASTNTLTIGGGPNLIPGGDGLQVSVIALIQTTSSYNGLLNRIASAAKGKFFTVTKASDVNDFFKYSLASALKNRSPQILEFKNGTLVSGQGVQKYNMNSNVKKIVFELSSADTTRSFSVEKNGIDLTSFGKFIKGKGYTLFAISLHIRSNPSVFSKGEWTMKISGTGNSGYRTVAIVDDHSLKYTSAIASTRRINSPLTLSTKLKLHGKAFTAATVTAIVLKPGQDLGTLLATTPARKDTGNKIDTKELSPGNGKLQGLLEDPEFYKSLLPKEQNITLTLQADSTYSGTFANTDVTGAYQVIFRIEGSTPLTGNLIRTDMETVVLELDQVDLGNSTHSSSHAKDTLKITIRPQSKSGLYLGPDYSNRITLTTSTGKVDKIIDHVDGSYTIVIAGVPDSVDPVISLSVLDQKVYDGKASDFGKPWWIKYWWIWILLIIILFILYKVLKK